MTIRNLSFFVGRKDKAANRIKLAPQAGAEPGKLALCVPLDTLPVQGRNFRGISLPVDMKSRPELDGDYAVSGSVITQKRQDGSEFKVLAAHQKAGMWYVTVRTGLLVKGGGILEDLIALQDSNVQPVAHGSFSLDEGAVKVISGKGAEMAKVPADRLRWAISRSRTPGFESIPQYRYDFWQVPVGAAVLVRDINGRLTRLVGGKDRLEVVDAPAATYGKVFEGLEDARVKAAKARADQRASGASQAPATAPKA